MASISVSSRTSTSSSPRRPTSGRGGRRALASSGRARASTASPPYRTVIRRFGELAELEEAILDATGHLIAKANEHEGGWCGFDIWLDATEAEDNVRLHHDCADGEACARRARAQAHRARGGTSAR